MTLDNTCVLRTARKPWRCTCADDVLGYEVRMHYGNDNARGWSSGPWAITEADAHERGRARLGERATVSGTVFDRYEVIPHRNPNAPSRSPECRGDIAPGDRYVEYRGDVFMYESGSRYCLPCGLATWDRPSCR